MADNPRVTVDDVRHVAMLARLGLTDERVRELAKDMNTILEHMDALRRVPTEDAEQALGTGPDRLRLYPDAGPPIPLMRTPESFAPEMRAGFFIVPRLATHEDAELSA